MKKPKKTNKQDVTQFNPKSTKGNKVRTGHNSSPIVEYADPGMCNDNCCDPTAPGMMDNGNC